MKRNPSLSDVIPDFLSPLQAKWCLGSKGVNLLSGPVPEHPPEQPVEPADEDEGKTDVLLAAAIDGAIPDDEED